MRNKLNNKKVEYMSKYNVYQIKEREWKKKHREQNKDILFVGSKNYLPTDFESFKKVCTVNANGGLVQGENPYVIDSLEEVFKVLNGAYYNEEQNEDIVFDNHVSDFEMKTITRDNGEVVTFRNMHSLSIGDIVEKDGVHMMCDKRGWTQVEVA